MREAKLVCAREAVILANIPFYGSNSNLAWY